MNQELRLFLSIKIYFQNFIPKFESLFVKEFKTIKTPMSEGFHTEVDDSHLYKEDNSANYSSIIC
jgi:hypothetical protein